MTTRASTLENTGKAVKCKAWEANGHQELMVYCTKCSDTDNIYQCTVCYGEMAACIDQTTMLLKAEKTAIPPIIKIFISIQWAILLKTDLNERPQLNAQEANVLEVEDVQNAGVGDRKFQLRWKKECPSCYGYNFPKVPPVVFEDWVGEEFASWRQVLILLLKRALSEPLIHSLVNTQLLNTSYTSILANG